jgi:hypothetical protein
MDQPILSCLDYVIKFNKACAAGASRTIVEAFLYRKKEFLLDACYF